MRLWGKITAFTTLMEQFHVEYLSVSQGRVFLHRRLQNWTLPVGKGWTICWLQHFAAIYVLQFNQTPKLLCKGLGLCRSGQSGTSSLINMHKVLCRKICNTFPYLEMMDTGYLELGSIVPNGEISVWMELGVSSCVSTIILFYKCLCFPQKSQISKKSWKVIGSG